MWVIKVTWARRIGFRAISEFPKGRKHLISLSFRGKSSVRPAQVGGFDVNIVIHGSRSSSTSRMAPLPGSHLVAHGRALWKLTAPWTHRTRPPRLGKRCAFSTSFHRAFPIKSSTKNPEKAPKWRWETRIDPVSDVRTAVGRGVFLWKRVLHLGPGARCGGKLLRAAYAPAAALLYLVVLRRYLQQHVWCGCVCRFDRQMGLVPQSRQPSGSRKCRPPDMCGSGLHCLLLVF